MCENCESKEEILDNIPEDVFFSYYDLYELLKERFVSKYGIYWRVADTSASELTIVTEKSKSGYEKDIILIPKETFMRIVMRGYATVSRTAMRGVRFQVEED